MPKKVLVALPPGLLEQIDFIAHAEHRTRSDLIREALRRYSDNFKRQTGQPLRILTQENNDTEPFRMKIDPHTGAVTT